MNGAHFHLVLTHFPLVLIPVGMAVYLAGKAKGHDFTKRIGLLIIVCAGVVVLPTYFSGENAEHVVKGIPGVLKQRIETHEGVAKFALASVLAAAVFALSALGLKKGFLEALAMAGALISLATLSYTGLRGGEIRHTELLPAAAATSGTAVPQEQNRSTDDDD